MSKGKDKAQLREKRVIRFNKRLKERIRLNMSLECEFRTKVRTKSFIGYPMLSKANIREFNKVLRIYI